MLLLKIRWALQIMIFIVGEGILLRRIAGCAYFCSLFRSFSAARAMSTNCGTPGETYFNYARIITRLLANGDLLAGTERSVNSFFLVSRLLTRRTMNYDCINNL